MSGSSNDTVSLSADIVAAYLRNNILTPAELLALVKDTYDVVSRLGLEDVNSGNHFASSQKLSSLEPESITCLDCGFKGKMLRRHLGAEHGLTPSEYRARWSLPADFPMVCPSYSEQRKELAVGMGLGRRFGRGQVRQSGSGGLRKTAKS
jgi:predicted transcriptional regulator